MARAAYASPGKGLRSPAAGRFTMGWDELPAGSMSLGTRNWQNYQSYKLDVFSIHKMRHFASQFVPQFEHIIYPSLMCWKGKKELSIRPTP